jgi:hypothetical protein
MPSPRLTLSPARLDCRATDVVARPVAGSCSLGQSRLERLLVCLPPGCLEKRLDLFIGSLVEDVVERSHCPEHFWSM